MRIPRKLKKTIKKAKALKERRENAIKAIQTMLLLTSIRSNARILQASPIDPVIKANKMVLLAVDAVRVLQKIYSK